MDCENFQDLLLDLAYGELDEVRAAAARKHAEGCADCRPSLARISQGRALARRLQLEPAPAPSAALLSAIESAARAGGDPVLAGEGAGTQGTPPIVEGDGPASGGEVLGHTRPGRAVSRWLERVGEIAMRRQVAMAAVFLLTIGVGLVFYQGHPRPSDAPDDRAPDVVPAEEVPGSPSARMAEGHAPVPRGAGSVVPLRPGAERDERMRGAPTLAAHAASESTENRAAGNARNAAVPAARADEAVAEVQGSNAYQAAPVLTNAAAPAGVARAAAPAQNNLAQQQVAGTAAAPTTPAAASPQTESDAERASLAANIRQLRDAIANTSDPNARYRYRAQLATLLRRSGDTAAAESVEAENRASVEAGAVPPPAAAAPPAQASATAPQGTDGSNADNAGASLQLRSRRAAPRATPRPAGHRSAAPASADYMQPMERPGYTR